MKNKEKIFAIAPMMDWTDRHCRYFHRCLTRRALLYTEMVVADAVIRGDRGRLIGFAPVEKPLALQLGGSEPGKLAQAARIGADFGYSEINLNVGCPSDRVQSGTFGACLMKTPTLVAECVAVMKAAVDVPITVKCRIGVDDQDPEESLDRMARDIFAAGADALWVHARKAWLQGLSPKENRTVPPLDYDRVYRLKHANPAYFIGINGGIASLADLRAHFARVDGAMIGRAAYHGPAMLADVDRIVFGEADAVTDLRDVIEAMCEYADRHMAAGGHLSHVTRHMIGLFQGRPGARRWRQILSSEATMPGAASDVLRRAYAVVEAEQAQAGLGSHQSFAGEAGRGRCWPEDIPLRG